MVWFLALRSLWGRKLRTSLTASGIAVAVAAMVLFLSLGEGLRQVFAEQLRSIGPDIQVSFGEFSLSSLSIVPELPLSYQEQLAGEAAVERVTPILFFVRGGFTPGNTLLFQGLPPERDVGAIYGGFEITEGRALSAQDRGSFVGVIGEQLAERREATVGDTIELNSRNPFEIVGVARSGGGFIDNALIVPIDSLQQAIDIQDRVTFFALELADTANASAVAERLSEDYPDLGFQTQQDVLGVIEQGIRISDVVRLGISVIALIVGAIAVANTVLMSVFERTREFGVVRALGAKPRFLFALVLAESVLLSLVGAAGGVALGRGGIAIVNIVTNNLIGIEVAALTLRLMLFSVVVALVMGLLSGLLPAARAARIPIAVAMARE
ncbi:MAG: ABC transporter permease [Trueperaceae bacterium]|nr:ABC transporter permease [Trueperaceae bacterium]